MKDGKPKYAAAKELDEYRDAIRILERANEAQLRPIPHIDFDEAEDILKRIEKKAGNPARSETIY